MKRDRAAMLRRGVHIPTKHGPAYCGQRAPYAAAEFFEAVSCQRCLTVWKTAGGGRLPDGMRTIVVAR